MTKEKILLILLPALFLIFGFGLGSAVTKLSIEKTKPQNQEPTIGGEQSAENPPKQETEYETYTVLPGDTLFGISIKFDVSMDELAKLNGITDSNQIKAGQVLKIPKVGATSENAEIDLEKMREIQAEVDKGNQPWRLDPVEVVKATAPASYEFSAVDTYTLKSKDLEKGQAVVEVKQTKDSKVNLYEVSLIQPVTKGEKGIWAISSIKKTV